MGVPEPRGLAGAAWGLEREIWEGDVGTGTREPCRLPSTPTPHRPGCCVYQGDFLDVYFWQSIALFCHRHCACLFPRFSF